MSSKARSFAAMKGKDLPRDRKKKKPSPAKEPTSISISITSLPDDLLLNCLARVSRLYYPTLSLVSKTFRSIVASPELYQIRSRLNRTERCLYLCLHFPFDPNTHWFTLCRKPNRTISNNSSGNILVQIPSPNYLSPTQSSSLVAVGSNIYKIGGADSLRYKMWKRSYSSSVSVLDCRSHKWNHVPSMRMNRSSSSTASLVDGKIYVAGGCKDKYLNSPNWVEVFDPKTQTWGSLKNPCIFETHDEFRTKGYVVKSLGLEGKLYLSGDEFVVYNDKEGRWNQIRVDRNMCWALKSSYCVIDDVLYFWDKGVFKWYDTKVSVWKDLNGVEGLPDFSNREYCKMVDLGGKIAVLWDECEYTQENRIWCAEIKLEKRDGDEIWGKVEWFDVVLIVGMYYNSFNALSASV